MSRRKIAQWLAVDGILFTFLMYAIPAPESVSRVLARIGLLGWVIAFGAAIFCVIDFIRGKMRGGE